MNELLVWSLEQARKHTLKLVEDVSEDQMFLQSAANENHPAWILGHLLLSDTYLLSLLKIRELSPDFVDLLNKYGPNPTNKNYDSKSFLVERLTETSVLRVEAVTQMEDLNQPLPDENLVKTQPTIGHHLQMLMIHEGHHCGQLSSWRKLHGSKPTKWTFAP